LVPKRQGHVNVLKEMRECAQNQTKAGAVKSASTSDNNDMIAFDHGNVITAPSGFVKAKKNLRLCNGRQGP